MRGLRFVPFKSCLQFPLALLHVPLNYRIVFYHLQQCSINSPDYGPLPSDAPSWCQAPFDPEGLLRCIYDLFLLYSLLSFLTSYHPITEDQ